jgi:DNA-binding NtrC family response regulator
MAGMAIEPVNGRVVVLDDEANMGKVLTKVLRLEGFEVTPFERPQEALAHLEKEGADVLLSDLRMPDITGEEVLERVRQKNIGCEVILMTAYGTVESAMRCVRQGAFDYVTKPFDTKALVATVKKAAQKRRGALHVATPVPVAEADRDNELLGESEQMQAVRELLRKIAPAESPVVIYGESGTGKELAARAVHRLSPRKNNRFLAINCASIPETLMESELFGHERGSFTGAHDTKIGLMEAAHGGTLFLDEIGELPMGLQAKLLRALQEREITRVGSITSIPVDIRVVAATNRNLSAAVKGGTFRQDLYYRLNVLQVRMPPLRQRGGDVPLLARHFLEEFRLRAGKPALEITGDVLEQMSRMEWPGNVRELRNFMERLVVLTEGNVIGHKEILELATTESQQLSFTNPAPTPAWLPKGEGDKITEFREARDAFEAEYLRAVLRAVGGNVSEAAKKAGMSRRNFYEKIEKLNIDPARFKD